MPSGLSRSALCAALALLALAGCERGGASAADTATDSAIVSGAALGIHTIAIHNADFGRDFYNTYTGAVIRVSFKERLFVNGEQLSHLAPYKKAYMLQGFLRLKCGEKTIFSEPRSSSGSPLDESGIASGPRHWLVPLPHPTDAMCGLFGNCTSKAHVTSGDFVDSLLMLHYNEIGHTVEVLDPSELDSCVLDVGANARPNKTTGKRPPNAFLVTTKAGAIVTGHASLSLNYPEGGLGSLGVNHTRCNSAAAYDGAARYIRDKYSMVAFGGSYGSIKPRPISDDAAQRSAQSKRVDLDAQSDTDRSVPSSLLEVEATERQRLSSLASVRERERELGRLVSAEEQELFEETAEAVAESDTQNVRVDASTTVMDGMSVETSDWAAGLMSAEGRQSMKDLTRISNTVEGMVYAFEGAGVDESEMTMQAFAMVGDPIINAVPPVAAKAGGAAGKMPMAKLIELFLRMFLVAPILKGLTDAYVPTITEHTTEQVVDSINAELDLALHTALQEITPPYVNRTVARTVTRALTWSLTESLSHAITTNVLLLLAKLLVPDGLDAVTEHLTGTIAHAVAPSVTHALTRAPAADYYCHFCSTKNVYCDYCDALEGAEYYRDYYSNYYVEYYAHYYAYYYSKFYPKYSHKKVVENYCDDENCEKINWAVKNEPINGETTPPPSPFPDLVPEAASSGDLQKAIFATSGPPVKDPAHGSAGSAGSGSN